MIPFSQVALRLHPEDDVAVAKLPLKSGTQPALDGTVLCLNPEVGEPSVKGADLTPLP